MNRILSTLARAFLLGTVLVAGSAQAQSTTLAPAADALYQQLGAQPGLVKLIDKDRNDRNPFLVPWKLDINKGNKQIAHAITLVLRPANL